MERGIITISEIGMVTIPTDPVWMTQQEMSDLFMVFCCDIRKAIRDIYKNHELLEETTMCYIRQEDGTRYMVYSLEIVIALAFSTQQGMYGFQNVHYGKAVCAQSGKAHSFVLFTVRSQSAIQMLVLFVPIMIIMQEADGRVIYLSPSASVPFTLYKIMFPFGKHSDTRPSPAFRCQIPCRESYHPTGNRTPSRCYDNPARYVGSL